MDRWIRHNFSVTKRAKCLILIGPTGTGKTSFALSLPGYVNYFHERWILDDWSDGARYSVYDDIPWDDFDKLNYPNKKGLLTQNGEIGVSMMTTYSLCDSHTHTLSFIGDRQISTDEKNQSSTASHCAAQSRGHRLLTG